MRVVIDLQSCQSGSRVGGIGRYSLDLAKAMAKKATDDEILILLNDRYPEAASAVKTEFEGILPAQSIKTLYLPRACSFAAGAENGDYEASQVVREAFLQSLNPDIVHVSSIFEGFFDSIAVSVDTSGLQLPTAVTLYDLIPAKQQKSYLSDDLIRAHYFRNFEELFKADCLLAISEFSASEALELRPKYPGDLVNIRGGIDPKFTVRPTAGEAMAEFLRSRRITGKFLLYTAGYDLRKNQRRLVEAFACLPADVRANRQLVLVGNGWPEVYSDLRKLAAERGLPSEAVIVTGPISDEALIGLYNLCELFVFPPLWEGLGLPALEAMACGAPVIGSNTTSIPEVLGRADAEFDPTSVASMAGKLKEVLTRPHMLSALREHSRLHHTQFSWSTSAEVALDALRRTVARCRGQGRYRRSQISALAATRGRASRSSFEPEQEWEWACCIASNEIEADVISPGADQVRMAILAYGDTIDIVASLRALRSPRVSVSLIPLSSPQPLFFFGSAIVEPLAPPSATDIAHRRLEREEVDDVLIVYDPRLGPASLEALVESQVRSFRRVYIKFSGRVTDQLSVLEMVARSIQMSSVVLTDSAELAAAIRKCHPLATVIASESTGKTGIAGELEQQTEPYRLMFKRASAEEWVSFWKPDLADVKLAQASFEHVSIKSDGDGLITFGPHIKLPRGLFRLSLTGETDCFQNGPAGWVEVNAGYSANLLCKYDLPNSRSGDILDVFFMLEDEQSDCEIRTFSHVDGRIVITSVSLLHRCVSV